MYWACSCLGSAGLWLLGAPRRLLPLLTLLTACSLPLPGRSPELREDLTDAFQQLALEMGIPADSIFILVNKGNACKACASSAACAPDVMVC